MTSESPTLRKHDRSPSPEASEDRSKRRKHRHHRHRHHHRRHRSSRDKEKNVAVDEIQIGGERSEIEVEKFEGDNNIDGSGFDPSKDAALVSAFSGVDYEMEEGEIVDDDLQKLKNNVQSDVESGEIEMAQGFDEADMGDNEFTVEAEGKKLENLQSQHIDSQIGGKVDHRGASRSCLSNGYDAHKYREIDGRHCGDDRKLDDCDDTVVITRRASMSYDKKQSAGSPSHLHELSKRSQSRSIAGEASYRGTAHEINDMDSKYPNELVDEGLVSKHERHRHGGRDRGGDRGRERSSSRHSERRERSYDSDMRDGRTGDSRERDRDRERKREKQGREDRQKDRERSRLEDRDRDRDRERGEERENARRRDSDMDRGRDGHRERERRKDREKDWERDAGKRDRDRGREGSRDGTGARIRDWDREYERERLSRHIKCSNVKDDYRNRDINHKRHSEDDRREGSRKNDTRNGSSKTFEKESSIGSPERENIHQEDYEEKMVMQLEEQEEDELEKIKEESRRRRQAIMEKYKNQQKSEDKSQDIVENHPGGPPVVVPSAEGVKEDFDNSLGEDVDETEPSFSVGKSPAHDLSSQTLARTSGLGEGTPKSERSSDMFHDDIFGESPAGVRKTGKGDGVAVEKSDFHDNWDDAEGYYGYRFGEVLDGHYEIIAAHGKGVFSTVVRAKDLKAKAGDAEEVAIKIIRNNETMYKAGMEELVILKKLVCADPENKRHCVRFLSTFKYRNHLCLVFESLHMNLREVLKKFGRNIGLKLTAVRAYAKQLFIALKHLKNCGVLHCDIKPDNMLVNEAKNVLKLCDFGNAMFTGKNEITPYLVSRFYRAPEIILGLPYDHPLDMWSVGCCLFELYTGKVLFPGHTNNDMLRLHMELKGPFPKKMLRKGGFTGQHFDQDLNFLATEEDPVSKKVVRKLIVNIKPKDFGSLISGYPGEDPKMVANFKDLMEKIFVLDPDKRITVSQALSHPFISGK